MVTLRTFCRVCEPSCGLTADVEDGVLVRVQPDRDHPVTKGFACAKGIATFDIHHDPDRVDQPLRRHDDGLVPESWDRAVADIARRLQRVLDQHGPSAVGLYGGNPLGFNALGYLSLGAWISQLGAIRAFSAGTQDCANKFAGSQAVYGSRTVHPLPDIERADVILVIGANPRASKGSFISVPNMIQRLREAAGRGATVHFVNPRRIESPEGGVGDTILIRPDTDVYFLAGLLHELRRRGSWRDDLLDAHGDNVDGLRRFVDDYPLERVAAVTGIGVEAYGQLVDQIEAAGGTAVYMSTGANMGRQGTLAYWLVQMLSLVTGNLDRVGGNLPSVGFYPNARSGRGDFAGGFIETEFGRIRRGNLPGNLLSHYILDVDEPIRALVVVAGNPLLSIGGEERLRKAFSQLELVVLVDLYANATAELADWVLPAADQFERPDLTVIGLGLQSEPFVQFTEAMVPPRHERREEWWIFARLAQEMGLDSPLDRSGADEHWSKYEHMLAASGLSLDALRAAPGGVVELPGLHAGRLFDDVIQHSTGRIDCCPPSFGDALERCYQLGDELADQPEDAMVLITRRDSFMHNSWMHNVPGLKKAGHDHNPLWMHPVDARALALDEGEPVRVWNEFGEVQLDLAFDDGLRPGVVAAAHGWGNGGAPGMSVARSHPGVNINKLLPIGPGSFEELSSQAHMTGIPVRVAAI
ncbi:MAG: molybdopterin-containing oxidoreductase family protein [Acidimicrobiales bacterium]